MTFPMNLSEKDEALRAEVYWEEFKNTPIERFESAVKQAIGCLTFFPKPAELHELISQDSHKEYLEHKRTEPERIEWMEPTEEGKNYAQKMKAQLICGTKRWLEGGRKLFNAA